MNQMKYNIEQLLTLAEKLVDINYCDIEDILSDTLLSSTGLGKYEKPTDILERVVNGLQITKYVITPLDKHNSG